MTELTETRAIPAHLKIVSVEEMQRLEAQSDAAGLSYAEMMENAGEAVADAIAGEVPFAEETNVLVLAGPGNNGGDGLVCARYLHEMGYPVRVYLWKRRTDPEHDYEDHFAKLVALSVSNARYEDDTDLDQLDQWLTDAAVVVDALLGTGANRAIDGELAEILDRVAAVRQESEDNEDAFTLVAVDTPSGLNCDTGEVDAHTVPADMTVTFSYAKQGHFRFPGADILGQLIVADIGIDPQLAENIRIFALAPHYVSHLLPERKRDSHKGTYGKAMAIVGSVNYTGAAYLTCASMGRVGAGLVTGALPNPVWGPVATALSEPTWILLPHELGVISESAVNLVNQKLGGYDAILLGPGLGQEETTRAFVRLLLARESRAGRSVLPGSFKRMQEEEREGRREEEREGGREEEREREGAGEMVSTPFGPVRRSSRVPVTEEIPALPPMVIDADGLNNLSKLEDWPKLLPETVILTPHPAEMARLCGLESAAEVTARRWELAREKAAEWNAVILLKGPYTVIAHPDGRLAISPIATPALATAGTGDVLAGAITGFLAQGLDPFDAACLASWIGGRAGELCEEEIGPAGVVASDLLPYLPWAMNELRH
ncbi:MAG: NAD(P)H-hydrate dehydratase [Caldilineaceae bacterium]|nr:NAD(P)H-hydrate dehydratase [Caldilineaceae bacterium]